MALEFWLTNTPIGFGGAVGTPGSMQLANGNVMVVWSGNNASGLNYAIYDPLAVQQSTGNLAPSATGPQFVYDLIPAEDGGFDILYRQDGNQVANLYLRHFGPSLVGGTPLLVDSDFATSTNLPAGAVALAGGGFAVAYTSLSGAPNFDNGDIALRIVSANGTVGPEIAVNTTAVGRQLDARVASNGQNLFVTWWDEATQDVRGQMLTLSGAKIGNEFLVPSTTSGTAGRPQIEALPNANYIVVWEADGADGADSNSGSARGRLFGPTGTALGNEFVLNQNTSGFQGSPDVTIMPDGTFFASWFDSTSGSFRWFNADGTPKSDALTTNFPGFQVSLITIDDGRIAAFGIDSNLQWLIIDTRDGNYDGNDLDNRLVSRRSGATTINGFDGNDTFYGNDDDDTLLGGEGNDTFRSKLGKDTLSGGPGNDTYYLTPFSHTEQHLTTIVELANGGNDTIWTQGNYDIPAHVEVAFLYEEAGTASLTGNGDTNRLIGNTWNNQLSGLGGNDILEGLGGNDTLNGGAGDDRLVGGQGNDRLLGGTGADVAVYAGNRSDYRVSAELAGFRIVDLRAGDNDGSDNVEGIEQLTFADGTYLASLDTFRLLASDGFSGSIGGSGTVFGSPGMQDIAVLDLPGRIAFDGSFNQGGDIVRLPGNASNWQVMLSGSAAVFLDGASEVQVPTGIVGMPIVFADGIRVLKIDQAAQALVIGNQQISGDPVAISAPAQSVTLPSGADPSAQAQLLLIEDAGVTASGRLSIFGTAATETVRLQSGNAVLDGSFNRGGDRLIIDQPATAFVASLQGSSVFLDSAATDVRIPIGQAGMTIEFSAGGDDRTLVLNTASGTVVIGTQQIGIDPIALSA